MATTQTTDFAMFRAQNLCIVAASVATILAAAPPVWADEEPPGEVLLQPGDGAEAPETDDAAIDLDAPVASVPPAGTCLLLISGGNEGAARAAIARTGRTVTGAFVASAASAGGEISDRTECHEVVEFDHSRDGDFLIVTMRTGGRAYSQGVADDNELSSVYRTLTGFLPGNAGQPGAPAAPAEPPTAERDGTWLSNKRASQPREDIDVRTEKVTRLNLGGPRVGAYGVIVPDPDARRAMSEVGLGVPIFMLLGWQFEWAWLATNSGFAGLFEIVPMVSGFEHGMFMPALNMMAGIRSASGFGLAMGPQFGIGNGIGKRCNANCQPYRYPKPYIAGLVAAGFAIPMGELLLPIDVVFSVDRDSTRIGLVFGFAGFL